MRAVFRFWSTKNNGMTPCAFSVSLLCLVLFPFVETCIPRSIQATVPQKILAGYVVSKVNLEPCGIKGWLLETNDPDFTVQRDGTISTVHITTIPPSGKSFPIWIQDQSGQRTKVEVNLSQGPQEYPVLHSGTRRRYKRRWSPLPFKIVENDKPPFPKDVDQVASDSSVNHSVYYTISGPGTNELPFNLFSLDSNSGMLQVHRPVDREEFPQFKFLVKVFEKFTHREMDYPLTITVKVEDVNDNAPMFSGSREFAVLEHCSPGTWVGRINSTDRDDPKTIHTKIKYSLLTGKDRFLINSQTGLITTATGTLDREVQDKHLVVVEIKDMNGAWNGLSNTATATVFLKDINDNPPTFTETAYSVKVEENKKDILVLRISVDDKDLPKTPNWNALFEISKGNENGNFRIETDPEKNEGLLYVIKSLDYEKTRVLKLEVVARNEAELVSAVGSWASVPVELTVVDVDEGPEFTVPNLWLRMKENTPLGTLIGTYTAQDPETRSSVGIKYFKFSDPASWIDVGKSTGELRIANTVDRESSFVKNDLYNITVEAVDASSKTGTGTVLIHIEDVNDHTPDIVLKETIVCQSDGQPGSVLLEAIDKDQDLFSGPFTFDLAENHDGKWTIKDFNGTVAVLQPTRELPAGFYSVPLVVRDRQGFGKEQTVTVRVCRCLGGECLPHRSSVALGPWGILAMLSALAVLLLLCIVSTLFCVTEKEKELMDDVGESGGTLLKCNTEGPGEEVVVKGPLTTAVKGSFPDSTMQELSSSKAAQGAQIKIQRGARSQSVGVAETEAQGGHTTSGCYDASADAKYGDFKYVDQSPFALWETNALYLKKKLRSMEAAVEESYADDVLHSYGFEGEGSSAGSVGCCSQFQEDQGEDFLNTLGPQFRALAQVCGAK